MLAIKFFAGCLAGWLAVWLPGLAWLAWLAWLGSSGLAGLA
jgi:hypothetical protein